MPITARATTTTAGVAATTTTRPSTSVAPALPPEKCPDAKTCRAYRYKQGTANRWPSVNGKATIRYWVNAASCPSLSADDMRRALEDATAPWEAAAPTVDFAFQGYTERVPAPQDGFSDVGCTQLAPTANAEANPQPDRFGAIREADMTFTVRLTWVYAPCEQSDGSCTAARAPDPKKQTGCCAISLNSVATHEFGHWLWLDDLTNASSEGEQTMFQAQESELDATQRWYSTLALGDVLGVRSLYPCSCPLPPIYSP